MLPADWRVLELTCPHGGCNFEERDNKRMYEAQKENRDATMEKQEAEKCCIEEIR
jgi:hypothetical protein